MGKPLFPNNPEVEDIEIKEVRIRVNNRLISRTINESGEPVETVYYEHSVFLTYILKDSSKKEIGEKVISHYFKTVYWSPLDILVPQISVNISSTWYSEDYLLLTGKQIGG